MATPADFTTRARDEMHTIYTEYQRLSKRIDDLTDEVNANGGAEGLYGVGGATFPVQPDGMTFEEIVAAFLAVTELIGAPTPEQKNAIIKVRR